ncbi:hypothetical protein GCM10008938_17660 [Deinococcus roseus]|uniref:Uncharacterized protein n=1 Tax=Deinococcus roseus TaxID=392414 RepID=A0ABQ2CZH4_9DEIO|nr:hypothetical protein GCM10008938_17660 [Deinococcus roseus]
MWVIDTVLQVKYSYTSVVIQQHLGTINGIPVTGKVQMLGQEGSMQIVAGEIFLPEGEKLEALKQAYYWVYTGPCTDMNQHIRHIRVRTRVSFVPTRNNSLVFHSLEEAEPLALLLN